MEQNIISQLTVEQTFVSDYEKAWASLVAQRLKHLPAMQETWVRSLGQENPLEKEMATHSSVLAWRIPGTAEPGGLPSVGSHRVGHDWSDLVVVVVRTSRCPRGWVPSGGSGGVLSRARCNAYLWTQQPLQPRCGSCPHVSFTSCDPPDSLSDFWGPLGLHCTLTSNPEGLRV